MSSPRRRGSPAADVGTQPRSPARENRAAAANKTTSQSHKCNSSTTVRGEVLTRAATSRIVMSAQPHQGDEAVVSVRSVA